MNIAIIASRFNEKITDAMVNAATEQIENLGHTHTLTLRVPGVYDTPLAVHRALARGDVDGAVVIGAVITGETDHDQILMHSTAKTLQEISLDHDKPLSLAITGPGMTAKQAHDRIDYAAQGVQALAELHEAIEDA